MNSRSDPPEVRVHLTAATLEAAIVEGFRCIGIEREADYLPLIEQRIARACPPLDFTEATA